MAEIGSLLDKVESNEIVLPEFQREFVWRKDQSKELMKSIKVFLSVSRTGARLFGTTPLALYSNACFDHCRQHR